MLRRKPLPSGAGMETRAARSEGDGRRRDTENAPTNDYMKAGNQPVRFRPDGLTLTDQLAQF